ncbi:MAG: divalent-cation tolerance protein CutA [Verrucomicrobium sp.]|nr:divalent-cation tolerance protein CutA [Verrucomicrobium sp.]
MTPIVVHVTVPDAVLGAAIGRALVEESLAACASIVPGITSIYRWQGEIQQAAEHLLVIKSAQELWEPLQEAIRARHPYEVPEIVAFKAEGAWEGYAAWWRECLGF